ncbi:putative transporter [Podospora australis]|uniref:Transporter n=1 Tax=Podospora australis TaxID=1536484 RepID=A0AAN6WZC7_9PEZI|nr:putative transporter [Podospora australis]
MDRIKSAFTPKGPDRDEYSPLNDDDNHSGTIAGSSYEVEVEDDGSDSSSPQQPFSWIEYLIFSLIGVAMLWAWNMFLAAAPYFQTRLHTDPWLSQNAQSAIIAVSTSTNLLAMLLLTNRQAGASYPYRINSALYLNAAVFSLLTISTSVFLDASPRVYFAFLLAMVATTAWAAGLMQNGAFTFAASFGRTEYTQAIMAGQGVAGILPPLTQVVSFLAFTPSPDTSVKDGDDETKKSSGAAMVYFLTAVLISGITLAAFIPLVTRHNRLVARRLLKQQEEEEELLAQSTNSVEELERATRKVVSMTELFRKLKWLAISVFMCFAVAMFFPVFTGKILSVRSPATSGRLFEPGAFIPLGFFFWNLGDLTGRMGSVHPLFAKLRKQPKLLFMVSLARFGFLPLYLLCNIRGEGALVGSDLFYLIGVQFPFGLTTGWLGSSTMMGAGEWVGQEEREAAGGFMGMCLVGGLTAGSLLSFGVAGI